MDVLDNLGHAIEQATESDFGLNKRFVLFGTGDGSAAARRIDVFVSDNLKARIVEVLFAAVASAGAFGLRLSDGRSVFLKIHGGEYTGEELAALHDAQELLRQEGIPAARRILPVTGFGNGLLASVHAFRERGALVRAGQRGSVEMAAAGLAELIAKGRRIAVPAAVPAMAQGRRHPFARRVEGVPEPPPMPEAVRAKAVFDRVLAEFRRAQESLPEVLGHNDWSARNLRFEKGRMSSIFDFEALRRAPEPLIVGHSAVLFINEPSGVPNPAGAAAHFIRCYEAAGRKFDDAESASADTGAALAAARFFHAAVRTGQVPDDEAPRLFETFMTRFRKQFGRGFMVELS